MQFPDFNSVYSRSCRPPQALAVLPGVGQTGPGSVPQDLSFKLGEDCQQSGHRATGRSREIERFHERDEPDTEVLEFLQGCQQIRN
jgi:hypothetical protein